MVRYDRTSLLISGGAYEMSEDDNHWSTGCDSGELAEPTAEFVEKANGTETAEKLFLQIKQLQSDSA